MCSSVKHFVLFSRKYVLDLNSSLRDDKGLFWDLELGLGLVYSVVTKCNDELQGASDVAEHPEDSV